MPLALTAAHAACVDSGGVQQATAMDNSIPHLKHPEKLCYPQDAITRKDVLDYYLAVSGPLLRFCRSRPLTQIRYPDGIESKGFFQKNPPSGAPAWLETWPVEGTRYIMLQDQSTIAYAVGLGGLEFHISPLRYPDAVHPDLAWVDLDPMPPFGFDEAVKLARLTLTALDAIGMRALIKTTGKRGIHLFMPILPGPTPHELFLALKGLGMELRRVRPELVTLERAKAKRHGVYFDFGQSAAGHTLAAPYSLRAAPGAPVSCPIAPEELPHISPTDFTLRTVPLRLRAGGDAWAAGIAAQDPAPLLRLAALASHG